ncbi:RHS repeat-associated core domain-containing protein [Catellatospora sp. NPDC049133]|uniref:RHS repeat-associated core domain-containing protein n=1 Tax=Catellatospora sp. NPDC049133 TaxID=3155499 RepID=UPI0033C746B4
MLALTQLQVLAPSPASAGQDRPAVQEQPKPAQGTPLKSEAPAPDPTADKVMARADTVTWPVAGVAELRADAVKPAAAIVGGLRVEVARAIGPPGAGVSARSAAQAPERTRVQVLDRSASRNAGVDGPVFKLSRADGVADAGTVEVTVGYAPFAHAYGGDWGARLRLVRLPGCALSTPERAECRKATPVASVNDTTARTVTASVDAAGVASGATVLAMSAGDSSTQGDYKATQLAPSSSWSTSLPSGGFSWTYPITTPAVPGNLAPQVAFGYSSQTVDGRTSATNNQGSWLGEGFSYEPGYIERRYKPCSDDGHESSGDQCWAFHNGSVMLSGHSGTLVKIDNDTWKLSNDDGTKVERVTGTVNGDDDGEYWKITTPDGTRYFFGLGRLPGWTATKEETESTWTAPVYGDDSGEPCHKTSGFADSYCDQAWRWNLDYVVDAHGNVISYFYDRETNHFARGGRTDVNGTAYHRAGYLARIDYGQRDGQVYTTHAPARVAFTTAERCIAGGSVDCDPEDLNDNTAASWPDVPEDRICKPNTHCESSQSSPTFFTRKRVTKVQTEIRVSGGWSPVDSWNLEHEFKVNDDASRTLWLKKITRSGHRGGATLSLPATELEGEQLPNRIVKDGDNLGPLIRYRLATIKTDTGSQITVNYKDPDCTKDNLPTAGHSTRRCYPVIWNPLGGDDDDQVTDWFHTYVVEDIREDDLLGGSGIEDMVTAYEYVGDPAWRKSAPDGITKTSELTWSQWRGYGQVIVRTGNGQAMPGRTDHFFLRGMSGAKRPDGTSPAVTVSDSTGTAHTDHDELSGHELETIVYDGTEVVTKTINRPWRHVTRTQTETWGSNVAALINTDVVRTFTAMPDDAQGNAVWRETRTESTFDPTWGRLVKVEDLGVVGSGQDADDQCIRTEYVDNPGLYLYAYVSREWAVSVHCGVTNPDLAQHLISDVRTSYDLKARNAAPTAGIATRNEILDRYDGTNIHYVTASETTAADGFGRPTAVRDASGHTGTTEYTETNGLTTQTKVTKPLTAHVTTTVFGAESGQPEQQIDANGRKTEFAFDALGRQIAIWQPDRDRSQGASPSLKFGYLVRKDKATVITTETLANDGTYRPRYELYDGLLRVRQTQVPGPGGWLVTDTFYDGRGNAYKNNSAYLVAGTGGDVPLVTAEGSVNGQTVQVYDGVGRVVTSTFKVAGDARWATTTVYEGNRVHETPPAGGTPTTTVYDARGKIVELHQYHGATPTGPADVTKYTYTPAGSLSTITDALDNVWRYHYNKRQLRELVEDPDSGDTSYTYDAEGRLTSTTDSRGVKLSYRYDNLDRKTELWQGELDTGVKQAAWVYDNAGNIGELHYSQRIAGGQNYFAVNVTRDSLYRPTKIRYTFPSGGVGTLLGKSYEFTTGYNTDGTVSSVGFPEAGGLSAEAVATTYDNLLRPTALTGSSTYVTATQYEATGQLKQAELFTGGTGKKAWLTYEYERGTDRLKRFRVDRQTVGNIDLDAHYDYDAAGNVLSIADTPANGARDVQCFEYDRLRRLTRAWSTASTTNVCADGVGQTGVGGPAPYHHSWTFDETGSRDTETIHSTTGGADTERDYTYPAPGSGQNQPHSLTGVTENGPNGQRTYSYTYDSTGNTVCRPNSTATNSCVTGSPTAHQALAWDAEGHLASSTPAGGQATTYVYDADGKRIVRKEPGGKTTLYLPGTELALNEGMVTGTRYYDFGGKNVAVRGTAGVHFQATDHHGTAVCSINATTGAITWRRTTPYGGTRQTPSGPVPDQRGFVGGTQDPTGLTHLGAREYDPVLGRFISVDPAFVIEDPRQYNAYQYAANNPVTSSDPAGLWILFGDGGNSTTPPPPTLVYKPKLNREIIRVAQNDPNFDLWWLRLGLEAVDERQSKSWFLKIRRTVILTTVKVRINGKLETRGIAFVSHEGLDDDTLEDLKENCFFIYQASPKSGRIGKGHAEAAAASLANDVARQVADLGGEIEEVTNYVPGNSTCSDECGVDGREYLDDLEGTKFKLKKDSWGKIGNTELDKDMMTELRRRAGLGPRQGDALKIIISAITQGWRGGGGRGGPPIRPGAEDVIGWD